MIILVGGEKGGSGKSCLAQNLAVYLQANNRDILLLDADPQGTTTDWIKERDENSKVESIPSVQAAGNIRQILLDLSNVIKTSLLMQAVKILKHYAQQ